MDSEAATGEINSTAGGSLAEDAEHEVNEQSNEDGSSASLAEAGGDEESNEVEEEGDEGADEAAMEGKRKRGKGREQRGEEEEKEEEEEGTAKKERKRRSIAREGATPVDRPSRERKRVERFAAMSPRKISVPKTPSFEQGSGQKLKDIPNVSFKLSKRKADENLRALHALLFGRKSTVRYLKRNILQFSGFVWSQNEEKQRTRVKEKLDKYTKERLLDFCDLLDIHAVKITTKKEEIVSNLLEFLESPCITRDVVLSEKKGKRRGQSKGISGGISSEKSNKKQRTGNKQPTADENGDTEENVSGDAKDETKDGEDDGDSSGESERGKSEDEEEQNEPGPTNKGSVAQLTKKAIAPSEKSKVTPVKKIPSGKDSEDDLDVFSEDEPSSPPESKKHSGKEMNELETMTSAKEKSSRTKSAKSTSTSSARKSDSLDGSDSEQPSDSKNKKEVGRKGKAKEKPPSKKEGTSRRKKAKPESEETNKKQGKSKPNQAKKNEPSTEELHSVVSKILKEVDFNTATLADVLRRLGAHFNTNLMDRKAEVKRIIEDVINNMTDKEDAEDEDGAEDDAESDDEAKKDSDKDDKQLSE